MEISCTLAMAKQPGVSATFHFIAVKDQHLILYRYTNEIASYFFAFLRTF